MIKVKNNSIKFPKSSKRLWEFVFMLFFFSSAIHSQSSITVVDAKDKAPIYLSHVKFSPLNGSQTGTYKWAVSNEKGIAVNPFLDSTKVEISFIGYNNAICFLAPNESKILTLTPSIFDLHELVITGHFVPIMQKESLYEITTIDKDRIEEKGANNLREALSTELNFKTNNGHANETSINLNGLSGNHVKFMIDGVPVEGRIKGNIDLSQIYLDEVDRIEIIDGPSSVAYGTNAIGGVVNVITKKYQHKKIDISLKSYYESIGQYNFSGKIGLKHKKNILKVSGGRNFFDGFANKDTLRYKDWKPREQYFGNLMLSRRLKHLKMTYLLNGFSEKMLSRGAPSAPYFETAFDTHYHTQRWSNKLLLKGRLANKNYIDIALSQSYYSRIRNIYFKDLVTLNETLTPSTSDQDTTIFNNYMARIVYNIKQDSSKVNYMIGTETKQDIIIAERIKNQHQEIGNYAIFANLNYAPIQTLKIQPALRYAYNTKYVAPLIPSLNILYNWNKNTDLRISYAKGFRAPSLKEMYIEFHFNSTINLWGNETLNSENSDHLNFSVDYHKEKGKHSVRITPKFYYSKINNLISLVQISNVDWQYSNVDYLITKGASLFINYGYENWTANVSYKYYGNYNSQFNNEEIENTFFYSKDMVGHLDYKVDSLDLSFNLSYKYTGTIKSFYLDANKKVKESRINDYQTVDLSISKQLMKKKMRLTLGVKNLFDVKEVKMIGQVFGVSNSKGANLNVLWGRSMFVSLSYNF